MPRSQANNSRIELRIRPEDKAVLARAAAIERLDLTSYIVSNLLPQAKAAIEREELLDVSERDMLRVLDVLENPPAAPDRLVRVAKAGRRLE